MSVAEKTSVFRVDMQTPVLGASLLELTQDAAGTAGLTAPPTLPGPIAPASTNPWISPTTLPALALLHQDLVQLHQDQLVTHALLRDLRQGLSPRRGWWARLRQRVQHWWQRWGIA